MSAKKVSETAIIKLLKERPMRSREVADRLGCHVNKASEVICRMKDQLIVGEVYCPKAKRNVPLYSVHSSMTKAEHEKRLAAFKESVPRLTVWRNFPSTFHNMKYELRLDTSALR